MSYIDLHTHSPHSDGTLPVEKMLCLAQELGLKYFAISDYNEVGAYTELPLYRHLFGGKIVPAVELTTLYRGEIIEILGYGIDPQAIAPFIKAHYPDNNTRRIKEAAIFATTLKEKGATLSDEFVRRMCDDPESFEKLHSIGCRPYCLEEMRKYPENVRFFESEKHFYTVPAQQYVRNYLFNPDFELYVDLSALFPSVEQVIDEIHKAGGLAFLAHTFVYSPHIAAALDTITDTYTLDGLECHYGTFTPEQKEFMTAYCDRKGLYKSGGSDFHGNDVRPDNPMGRSAGQPIPQSLMDPWIQKIKTI